MGKPSAKNKKQDTAERIRSLNEKAWQQNRSDPDQCIEWSEEAHRLAEESDDKEGKATALRNLGACHTWKGNYKKAIQHSRKALQLFEELQKNQKKSQVLYILGTTCFYIGDYDTALDHYVQCRKWNEAIQNEEGQANALNGIGSVYYATGHNEKAVEYLHYSLQRAQIVNNQTIQMRILGGLASSYNNLEKYNMAEKYINQCLELSQELENKYDQSYALNILADTHEGKGEFDKAVQCCQESIRLRKELGLKGGEVNSQIKLGNIFLSQNKFQKAEEKLTTALQMAQEIESKEAIFNAHQMLAELYKTLKNTDKYIEYLEKAYESREKLRNKDLLQKTRGLELQFELEKENTQLKNKALQEKTKELEQAFHNVKTLNKIGWEITSSLNLEEVLFTIYERVNELMEATIFGIGFYDPDQHQIEYKLAIEKGKRYKPYTRDTNNPNQIPVWCIEQKKSVMIGNFWEEYHQYINEFDPETEKGELEDDTVSDIPTSLLYLPLMIQDEVKGVITVQSYQENAYSKQDLEMLRTIASYASIAVENARLYENMDQQVKKHTREIRQQKKAIENSYQNLKLLSDIGHQITTCLSAKEIVRETFQHVKDLMDADVFGIGIYDPKEEKLDNYVIENEKILDVSFSIQEDRLGTNCFRKEQYILLNEWEETTQFIEADEYELPAGDPTESVIYLPISVKGKTIGVITAQSFEKNAYDEQKVNMLRNLAAYVGVAIENTRSYNTLATLNEVGQDITSSLDLNQVLKTVYNRVKGLMDAPDFLIASYDEDNQEFQFQIQVENHKILEDVPPQPLEDERSNYASWCFHNQEEIFITHDDEEYHHYIDKSEIMEGTETNTQSIIYIPLMLEGEVTGLLSVQSVQKNAYNQNHLQMLRSLASYTAVALNNAESYQRLQEAEQEITQKNEDLLNSIQYAQSIQKAVLPLEQNIKNHLSEFFAIFEPRDIVSGDFYWFHEAEDELFLAVVDCTGHGVPGAFMSMIGNDLLNEIVIENHITDPGTILQHLHEKIVFSLNQAEGEMTSDDGMDMGLCKIVKTDQQVEFAGAGRPLWVLSKASDQHKVAQYLEETKFKTLRASKEHTLSQVKGQIYGIGGEIQALNPNYQTYTIPYGRESSFYLFSDGVVDQLGGAEGKKFTKKQLSQLILQHHHKSPRQQKVKLKKALQKWQGDHMQVDDITLVGFKP